MKRYYQLIKNPESEQDYMKRITEKNSEIKPNYSPYVKNPKAWVEIESNQVKNISSGEIVQQSHVDNPSNIYNQVKDGKSIYYFRISVIGDPNQIHRWNTTTNETECWET